MGLETVKEEVLGSAREQEAAMLSEAKKEAAKMMKEAEAKIESFKEKSDAEAKKAIDMIKRQAIASAELESKKMILESKKEIIDKVFSEAKKKIEGMDDKKKDELMKKLLDKAKAELKVEHVYCNKKDAKSIKGFDAQPAVISGGLIAENKEKTIRVDYSLDTLLDGIKELELQSVNKILFG